MVRMETMIKDRDETIEKLQRVIEQCIEDRNLKQKDVLELCSKKGYTLKQSELSRILGRKTTLALYPAIALSDALEIDMSAVLYPNRWRRCKWDIYRLDHAVSKTQKVVLSAFGISAEQVKYKANYISENLRGK